MHIFHIDILHLILSSHGLKQFRRFLRFEIDGLTVFRGCRNVFIEVLLLIRIPKHQLGAEIVLGEVAEASRFFDCFQIIVCHSVAVFQVGDQIS